LGRGRSPGVRASGLVAVTLLLAGCGASSVASPSQQAKKLGLKAISSVPSGSGTGQETTVPTVPPSATPVGTGFLFTDDQTLADFLQWTDNGGAVAGTLQEDTLTGSAPNEDLSTATVTVAGQIQGSKISVSLNSDTSVFGTYSNGTVTLNIPQNSGTLAAVTFRTAPPSAFNLAVSAIQRNISSQNSTAAVALQAEAAAAAIDKAAQAVTGDVSQLSSDQSAIASAVAGLPPALAKESADLGTTAQDEQATVAAAQAGQNTDQVCTDADQVASDADGVSAAADNVQGELNQARSDASSTATDLQAFQAAEANDPSAAPSGLPTSQGVDQAISSTTAAVAAALATTNQDVATANTQDTAAYNDAVAASQQGDCAGPAQPFVQPTIS
jgi:hypothetical protein